MMCSLVPDRPATFIAAPDVEDGFWTADLRRFALTLGRETSANSDDQRDGGFSHRLLDLLVGPPPP